MTTKLAATLAAAIRSNTTERIARTNAAHTAAEFAASYTVKNGGNATKKLAAKLQVATIPVVYGHKGTGKKAEALWTDVVVPVEVVASNVSMTKDGEVDRGVVFFRADLRKVGKKALALLIANHVLLPPTKDGANLLIES